jgi:hypothetical protein
MDGVGEHGSGPQPAGPVVDVEVVASRREQPGDLRDLARVLGDVRLPPRPGRPGERRRLAQHLLRARHREPGRDRVAQPPVGRPVPARDQVCRLLQGASEDRRRLDRRVVRQAVHHHLAEDRPDPVCLGSPERLVHRRLVDDAVGEHGRRPRGRERPEDRGRQAGGDGRIGPRPLGRERQPVEPGQQVEGEAKAGVRQLRQVGVEVDHPGQEDPRPEVERAPECLRHRGRRGRNGPCERDPTVGVDDDGGVGLVERPAAGQRRQHPTAERERSPVRERRAGHDPMIEAATAPEGTPPTRRRRP